MSKTSSNYLKHSLALFGVASLLWIGSAAMAQSVPTQDNDTTIRQLSSFDDFMDGHPEIAEQLRRDPSLVKNQQYLEEHPALQGYFQRNPGVQEEINENPRVFMHEERGFERQETRRELTNLDQFLDSHSEIAEQLRKNPALANDPEFVKSHPALQEFLQTHGNVKQELRQNPDAFMQQEERFDRREDRQERGQFANLDRFLDSHPEIAEQLRKDPSLVNDKKFVEHHPALKTYLQQNPGVRQGLSENPNGFMRQEQRFDQREDQRFDQRADQRFERREGFEQRNERFDQREGRDRDVNRAQLASMDRFLDSHPEVAEQLQKDPALVNDKKFVQQHPALQSYLQQNPGVREEFQENPNAFMHREQRFDQRMDNQQGFGRNNGGFDRDRDEAANFGQFLGGHANIAQQIAKDPSLVNNKEYMESHPELREYLKTHPAAQAQLQQNPQAFLQSAQQTSKPAPKAPPVTKPAQKQH